MEPFALSLALVAIAIVWMLRRPWVFSPSLAAAECYPAGGTTSTDDEEQVPETDRAPRAVLPWVVAAVAVVRVGLLVVLHA